MRIWTAGTQKKCRPYSSHSLLLPAEKASVFSHIAMSIRIGSSIASLRAQRKLNSATDAAIGSMERLGSGMRINRASDDAAGLAIAASLQSSRKVYTQAIRNLNDGISMLTIADAAAENLGTIVTRIQELAEQSANGVYGAEQRKALHAEAMALSEEYNRIRSTTKFNGNDVMTTLADGLMLQGGVGLDEALSLKIVASSSPDWVNGITRASVTESGTQAVGGTNGNSSLSYDGRFMAFNSGATNLITGDTNALEDIYLRDLETGTVTRVSTTSSGGQVAGTSLSPSISADGRYVAFQSDAANMISGDTNAVSDIFVKDMETGIVTRESTSVSGVQANGASTATSISGDGRYVTFLSTANNLVNADTNGVADIFVKDRLTGNVTLVSSTVDGTAANGASSGTARISRDGRYVSFQSSATNLVAGDTNGQIDVFVKDLYTGNIVRASTTSAGGQMTGTSGNAVISDDGRYVSFQSNANNVIPGDTSGANDIFFKDLLTGTLTAVSVNAAGQTDAGASILPTMSGDGRYVSFTSLRTTLVSGDTNGLNDAFVRDMVTGELSRVSLTSTGGQVTGGASGYSAISGDGRVLTFSSLGTNIVSGDTNGNWDIFSSAIPARSSAVAELRGVDLRTAVTSRAAIDLMDEYRSDLNSFRGSVGAMMYRLGFATRNLSTRNENYSAAESRISDADVAAESSILIRSQILQQTGASILAQANQEPAIALTLLR